MFSLGASVATSVSDSRSDFFASDTYDSQPTQSHVPSDLFARAWRGESSAIHYEERLFRSTPSALYSPDDARRDFFARGTPADEDGNALRSFRKCPRRHLVHPYAAATFSQVASPHEVALGCSPWWSRVGVTVLPESKNVREISFLPNKPCG